MALEEYTMAEAFKDAGYKTFFAGKWHLGETEEHWPEHPGFDINIGGNDKGAPSTGKKYFSPYDNPQMENGPEGEYLPLIAPTNAGIIGQVSSRRWQLIGTWTQYRENKTGAPAYGQSPTKAYGLGQIITRYKTSLWQAPTTFQLTVDNITNTQFTPYNAWNDLPGMGRNITISSRITLY
jgi:hypothetical protein